MRCVGISAILLFAVATLTGQHTATLEAGRRIPAAGQTATGMTSTIRCDSAGKVYFRPLRQDFRRMPVTSITADGTRSTGYSLPDELKEATILDFTLDRWGKLYLLVEGRRIEVVRFDDNGQVDGTVALQTSTLGSRVWPRRLGVFGTGELLLLGRLSPKKGGPEQLFAGMFNRSGEFMRSIELPARKKVEGESDTPLATSMAQLVGTSHLESGGDGNIYFAGPSALGGIFAITPAGTVKERIQLHGPPGSALTAVRISDNRGAALFLTHVDGRHEGDIQAITLSVFDLLTGGLIADYGVDSSLGAAFACFNGNEFTFLRGDKSGRLLLVNGVER